MTPNPDLNTLACRHLPGGEYTQLSVRSGTICLLQLEDEATISRLVYINPVREKAVSWRGNAAGYALTISYQALSQLPLLGAVAPYFLNYRAEAPTELATGPEVSEISSVFSLLTGQQREESSALRTVACATIVLRTRQLIRQAIPFDGMKQPSRLVARFAELVELHYIEQYGLDFYACQLYVTIDHLSRTCQRVRERTAKEILSARRFQEIERLLLTTDLLIKQIADRLHFSDSGYFTRTFTDRYGLTPQQFRKQSGKV